MPKYQLYTVAELPSFEVLRGYVGRSDSVCISVAGSGGLFAFDPFDTTSADDGADTIVGNDGRRWKRITPSTEGVADAVAEAQSLVDSIPGTMQPYVTAAEGAQEGAETAQAAAENALEQSYAAGRVYEDAATGDGDAGLSNGDYFYVISAEDAEVFELWQKDGSGGTDTGKRSPSNAAISSVAAAVTVETERATAAEDGLREDTDFLLDQFSMSMTSALAGSASALPSNPLSYRRMTLPDGTRVAVPVYTVVEPLDLFVIVGQSNAEGRGDSAQSPAAPEGVYINGSTISAPLADPVGGASTGSMWPAWSNEWFARTGRMSAFVEAAVGGTALLPDDSAQWSPAGSLRGIAVTAASNAISAINGSGSYTLGNVYFVWAQGESDAVNTNGTTVTAALYTDALKTLATYFKAQIPAMVKMFVVTTGLNSTSGPTISQQTLNYAAIRGAQVIAASEDANIEIVYSGTPGFIAAGMMADGQHYSQTGLNIAGKLGAASASGASITPAALNRLAATSYADASDANKSSRTLVHTAQTAAKSVLLLVHGTRNSIPTITATYAGETMTNVGRAQFLDSATATVVAAFLYNDADGVGSGSIVVSSSSALLSAHCEVLEFDAPAWVEGLGSNLTTVSDTSQSHEVVVAQPAQLVTAVGSVSAAASSVTFTGATELHEASLLRTSVSTYYTFAVAAEEVTQTETISTTHSTTCTHINALSIALRRVHTDEA